MSTLSFNNCLIYLLLTLLLYNCNPKNIKNSAEPSIKTIQKENVFPDDWFGYWTGDLNIYNSKGLKQVVPMALDLSKTDTIGLYNWAIIYGSDSTAQKRNYQLKEIDKSNGHYVIDEKNGIFLDAYYLNNDLISIFEVMGNSLITSYSLNDNQITFDIKMHPSEEIRISGDTLINNQEIPKVSSFKVSVYQKAILQKKCLVE